MNSRWIVRFAVLVVSAPAALLAQAAGPEPLSLRQAVELALERAPQLASVRAAREEGAASAALARDAFHPAAYFSTTPGYTYGLPTTVAGQVPAIASVEIRQTIYDKNRRSVALQAQATESALDASLAQTCRSTIEAVVGAYARSFLDGMQVEAARRRLDASERMAGRITALFEEGRRRQLDVERATLSAARARQKLLNAESDRDLSELELKRLIGWPGSSPLRLAGDPEAVIPELQQTENLTVALAADPGLKALGREVELLGESASVESKRWLPVIEASAHYQRLAKFNNYDDYYLSFTPNSVAVGVSVLLPLWTGGRFDDGQRQARARLDRAEADLRVRHGDVAMEVRRAEAAVARATAEKSLSRRARGIADQTRSAEEMLVREGRSEPIDLDASDIALADSDEEAARASLDSVLERVRLLSLRGSSGPRFSASSLPARWSRGGACPRPSASARRGGSGRRRRGCLCGRAVGGEELGEDFVVVRLLAQPRVLAREIGDRHVGEARPGVEGVQDDGETLIVRQADVVDHREIEVRQPELGGRGVGPSVLLGPDRDAQLHLLEARDRLPAPRAWKLRRIPLTSRSRAMNGTSPLPSGDGKVRVFVFTVASKVAPPSSMTSICFLATSSATRARRARYSRAAGSVAPGARCGGRAA